MGTIEFVPMNEFLNSNNQREKRMKHMNANERMGNYTVVSLVDKDGKEEKLFFRPVTSVKGEVIRRLKLSQYKNSGYTEFARCNVNFETFTDIKIDHYVAEYMSLCLWESDLRLNHVNEPWFNETVESIKQLKIATIAKISLNIRRLKNRGYECKNPRALELFKAYEAYKEAV